MYRKEFIDLVNHCNWRDKFIGYGNPDSDILIIGQEVAHDEESGNQEAAHDEEQDDCTKFYTKNHRHHIHPKAWIEKYAGDVRKALPK